MATTSSVGNAVVVLRAQIAKQGLAGQDKITVGALLDGYVAELQSMGVAVAGASAASSSSTPDALGALSSQLSSAAGLSGYQRGAVRDRTAQLVAQLQAHGVTVTS